MTAGAPYRFRRAAAGDAPLLADWRARPHVRAWWGAHDPDDDAADDPRVARWIVETEGRPLAFLQDYAVHGWDGHHFDALPAGSRGIDQYIGEPGLTGRGHGPAFIAMRVRSLFEEGAPVVATDPHPDNGRAIAAYRKVGFDVSGPPRESEWGPILPMQIARPR